MPKPQERDLDQTKIIFSSWLETQLDGATDLDVELLGGPENTGFSNETLSFNVSYELEFFVFTLKGFLYFLTMIFINNF